MMARTLTALVVVDHNSFYSHEEQIQDIVEEFETWGIPIKVTHSGEVITEVFRKDADLLIFDYGGVGLFDRISGRAQTTGALLWAENHPSSAVICWTQFTARLYDRELAEAFGDKPVNFKTRVHDGFPKSNNELVEFLKLWFNIPT